MGKNKLRRFAENETFPHLFQPSFYEYSGNGFDLKGNWKSSFFINDNPITLELGCGRGEYTVALAKSNPHRNFIGVDIKGARLWRGAKTVQEDRMTNVAFLRTRIDQINHFFSQADGIDEIWVTFPDPQPRESRENRRLTSARFLQLYSKFLQPKHTIHLKTDNTQLYEFTLGVIENEKYNLIEHSNDVYRNMPENLVLTQIKTRYEQMFLNQGIAIKYIQFHLPSSE